MPVHAWMATVVMNVKLILACPIPAITEAFVLLMKIPGVVTVQLVIMEKRAQVNFL